MKKYLARMLALLLAVAVALPVVAFASPFDGIPQREEGGTTYVPLRQVAEAHNATVVWDAQEQTVTMYFIDNSFFSIQLGELVENVSGFIEEGVTWIPLVSAEMMFAAANVAAQLLFELTEEARDMVLYDFQYMVRFILENSPWDSIITRGLGIDFAEFVADFEEFIYDMEPYPLMILDEALMRTFFPIHEGDDPRALAANYLFALLTWSFAPHLMGIGHLSAVSLDYYTTMYTSHARAMHQLAEAETRNPFVALRHATFAHPAARWFYGAIEVDLDADDAILPIVPGNITTERLQEDDVNIAYMHINNFWSDQEYDDAIILPFLQAVRDYDHLIIDLRGNWGGEMSYPIQLLLRRLINEPLETVGFEFFAAGSAAVTMMQTLVETIEYNAASAGLEDYTEVYILPAREFIAQRNMTEFNESDLERLEYVTVSRSVFFPCEDAVGFTGEIWILVDSGTASAANTITGLALSTGFATVVGENTSRIMGATHVYVALPNTGIIWRTDIGYMTDDYGRSLEFYGLTPNIRNFDGMDALQTALVYILSDEF
ncbi:MAG: S41 family peptidase [Defluviitaleaceae bacterium]|nr:S41 family peptidase [Defluviitaleaceae bacterium]MCL2275262.1 S41 family peptidase [Defluviitaleaceae bacterium]